MKKTEVASAISSVKEENFVKTPGANAADLIKGKVPGLVVNNPDGNPVSSTQISLRGATTLKASTAPLVLIDGIPYLFGVHWQITPMWASALMAFSSVSVVANSLRLKIKK